MNSAPDILNEITSPDVVMVEVLIYWIGSILFILFFDWYAARRIGGRNLIGYQVLKAPRMVSILIITVFTLTIGVLCLTRNFTVTRGILSYFGIPYLIAVLYFMIKVFRRVRAETEGRMHK